MVSEMVQEEMLENTLRDWIGGLQSYYQKYIEDLLRSEIYTVLYVSRNPVFRFPGVYVIYDDDDIFWVGKTERTRNKNRDLKLVKERIKVHKGGSGSSDLNRIVGKDICSKCKVVAIEIADDRERMLVECFFTAILRPKYNKPQRD